MYSAAVNARDLPIGRGPGLLDRTALLAKLGGHGLHDFESLDAFGMAGRGQMIGEDRDVKRVSDTESYGDSRSQLNSNSQFPTPLATLNLEPVWELEVGDWELKS